MLPEFDFNRGSVDVELLMYALHIPCDRVCDEDCGHKVVAVCQHERFEVDMAWDYVINIKSI